MTRLYLRIFLSFWLVIVLTLGAVLAINSQLDRLQRDDTAQREWAAQMHARLIGSARQALEDNGRQGLAAWAEQPQRRIHGARAPRAMVVRRFNLYVFDHAGEEILGRAPNRSARRVVRHWQRDGSLPDQLPRGQFAQPLAHPEHGRYLVFFASPPRPILFRILGPLGLWGLIGLAVLISGGICFWLARTITRPVRQLQLAGQILSRGSFNIQIPGATLKRSDELGDLARGFTHMAERLENLVAAQRQLLRDVSHELRSPLARLQTALTLATDSQDEAPRKRYLERTDVEVQRLNRLIGEILSYARLTEGDQARFEPLDLVDLIEDIAASARLEGAPRGLQVTVTAPASIPVCADEELLHRAIENVVRNALRHAPDGSAITLDVKADPETATVEVADHGPGIPEDRLADVFEPFVRLSAERGETGIGGGIGLAIARAALEQHSGSIRAENRAQGGLAVRMNLPRHSS